MRYVLDFGSANAGKAPTFGVYARLDTLAALAQPAIVEIGSGLYYFDIDWSVIPATSLTFQASVAGVDLSDVVNNPSGLAAGATLAGQGSPSALRYVLDFGTANAGLVPVFSLFDRLDTLAAVAQPAIVEISNGQYYFVFDWTSTTATSLTFKATVAGVELSDVISSPSLAQQGAAVAQPRASSLAGYSTVTTLINRAAVQCGLAAVADPFASTDPNFGQMVEFLNSLGTELSGDVNTHLQREYTLVTAGGATSYALPADYREMVPDTEWNRSGFLPLYGPVSPSLGQFLKAWNGAAIVNIKFRVQGNRITFPVSPGDGLTLSGLYVSSFWVQTAASGTGPDADHATLGTDYVLFDPQLIVLGLKLRWLEAKGFDTAIALTRYSERLDWYRGVVAGAGTLSFAASSFGFRLVDTYNAPPTGLGS